MKFSTPEIHFTIDWDLLDQTFQNEAGHSILSNPQLVDHKQLIDSISVTQIFMLVTILVNQYLDEEPFLHQTLIDFKSQARCK